MVLGLPVVCQPQWQFVQTCVACKRLPSCWEFDCDPVYGGYSFCGSYDYVEGGRRTNKRYMWCGTCDPEDPIVRAMDYADEYLLAYACISGQDCF